MSKHTAGKWSVGNPTKHEFYIGVGSGTILATLHDDTHDMGSAYAVSHEEAQANARLIAAAPDMLAALKWLAQAQAGDRLTSADLEKIDEAIQKAEGDHGR